jgi:hypothetical protein
MTVFQVLRDYCKQIEVTENLHDYCQETECHCSELLCPELAKIKHAKDKESKLLEVKNEG